MNRWVCEEGYRFAKRCVDLEGVQARKLIEKARRQKEKKPMVSIKYWLATRKQCFKGGGVNSVLDIHQRRWTYSTDKG